MSNYNWKNESLYEKDKGIEQFLDFLDFLLPQNKEDEPAVPPTPSREEKNEPKDTSNPYTRIAHKDMLFFRALINEGFTSHEAITLLAAHINSAP